MLYFFKIGVVFWCQKVCNRAVRIQHGKVWGYDFFGDTRAVDTQIKRIRQKLPDEELPWSIKTVYGVGYKFEVC